MKHQNLLAREPMSVVDTAWLRMDTPDNLMIINGVMEFATPLSRAALLELFSGRLLDKAPRFATRPVREQGRYYWQQAGALDWDYHLSVRTLDAGVDEEFALQTFCSRVVAESLDQLHPLWRFFLIESYRGGCAVVFKIHHSYADGIALISILDAIADQSVLASSPAARAALKVQRKPGDALHEKIFHSLETAVSHTRFAAAWLFEAGRVVMLSPDTKTAYKRPLGTSKRVAWARSLPLDEVKRVAKHMNGTVNDVVMACAAGSLRRHLQRIGQSVDDVVVRASVPVNLRPLEDAMQLGNRFGLVYLELPVSGSTGAERIRTVHSTMRRLKSGAQAVMSFGVLSLLGHFPAKLQKMALDFFSSKASAVMTNVPGPSEPVYMMGARLRRAMFWVPQSGGIGIGLSILSYDQRVEFGVVADTALVNDPQEIVDDYLAEFALLLADMQAAGEQAPQAS